MRLLRNTVQHSNPVRALTVILTAVLLSTLFAVVQTPQASADFYHATDTSLPNDGDYKHFDQSSLGTVIATANGCRICAFSQPDGYAYISLDSGVTFTAKTSVGKQAWRGVQVSSDGQKIALLTKSNVYFSSNAGSDFSIAYTIPITDVTSGKTILAGAMSGDGKVIYLSVDPGIVMRLIFDQYSRRWLRNLNVDIPNYEYSQHVATNSDGSKAYFASDLGSIYKVTGNSISAVANTRVLPDNSSIYWLSIKTSNSGDEVIALPWNSGSTGIFYRSTNSAASFAQITTINGATFDPVTAIEISGDGNSTFLSTSSSSGESIYSQHGKTATWYQRMQTGFNYGYDDISSNNDGSSLITNRMGWPLQILPGTPNKPRIYPAKGIDNSAWVKWDFDGTTASDSMQSIYDIQLQYSTSSTGPWTTFDDGVVGGATGWIQPTGLTSRTTYYFRARAQNYFGYSSWSDVGSSFIYDRASAPAAPTQVTLSDKSKLFLRFNDASDLGGADHIYNNAWQYSTDSGATWREGDESSYDFGYFYSNPSYYYVRTGVLISDITPGTPFMVRTSSYNGMVYGAYSQPATFYVYKTPSAVNNFQVNTVFTTATLTWDPPSDLGGGTLFNYKYSYKKTTDSTWTDAFTGTRSATITGLQGGSSYDYRIQAVTTIGMASLTAYVYNGQAISPPIKLSITRNSSGAKSSQAFTVQPKVSLLDSGNSVVTSDSNALVIAEVNNGGVFVGNDSVTAISGVATFTNLGLKGKAGTQYTITYRSSNLTIASETLTLQAGPISAMKFETSTVGGANNVVFPTQPVISVIDSDGNRVTTDETTTVTLNTSQGFLWDGSHSSPTATAVHGLVTFNGVKINGANGSPAVLTYTASNLASLQETITITTGPASTFTRTTRAMDAYIGGAFGTQPVYQVTDSSGNVVTAGEYIISISSSQGTLIGKTSTKTVNGVGAFTDLGLTGVNASQLVILTVTSTGFTPYTGDSIITRAGHPVLSWSDYFIPRGTGQFTIPRPDSSTAGTFSYSSSNTSVISISGSTVTVGNAGTATITATFTPANTSNYLSGDTITALFTVVPSNGTLLVAAAGGVAQKGIPNTLTATASDDGSVTFYANGKRIAGCISVRTQSSVATCSWKPSVQGTVSLTALLVPTNEAVSAIRASAVNVSVIRRTGRR